MAHNEMGGHMGAEGEVHVAGGRIDEADFSGARLHAANFEGVRITDGWLHDAVIEGEIDGMRVNGVEIAPLVEAELDRIHPERVRLRATDPAGFTDGWSIIEEIWRTTIARATALPEPTLHVQVDGDWSFVETLRHLVFATDCWLGRMVRGEDRAWHPLGLPSGGLGDTSLYGLDLDARPTLDEVLSVRAEKMAAVRATIEGLDDAALERVCRPPEDGRHPRGPHTVARCLRVILNEEFEHCGYANRDLSTLEATAG